MENIRLRAKQLKEEKKYNESIELYKEIYASNSSDEWVAWEYSHILKKAGQLDKAIEISKANYSKHKDFKYNNVLLTSLLYDKYFKSPKANYSSQELNQLYKIAIFIGNLVSINDNSPYQLILINLIKILGKKSYSFSNEIISLLNLLDSNKLSSESGRYLEGKKEKEYQSPLEFYYSMKTKMLFKTKNYKECIRCSEEALSQVKDFHHDNDLWIQMRKSQALAKMGDINKGITDLENISLKKRHWKIHHNLALLYLKNNDPKKGGLYFCIALLSKDPDKMKVNLFQDMATHLMEAGETTLSVCHAKYAIQIRTNEGWNIPKELELLANSKKDVEINLNTLKSYWLQIARENLGLEKGTINFVHKNGKFGFISSDNSSYYFQKASFIDSRTVLKKRDSVCFSLIDSFDHHKQKKTREAILIT